MSIDMANVVMIYEEPNIYDGWSVARLNDGRLVNRWPEGDRRHDAAEKFLESIRQYEADHNALEVDD